MTTPSRGSEVWASRIVDLLSSLERSEFSVGKIHSTRLAVFLPTHRNDDRNGDSPALSNFLEIFIRPASTNE